MSGLIGHFDKQFPKKSNLELLNNYDYVKYNLGDPKNFYDSLANHMNLNQIEKHKFDYDLPKSHDEYNNLINKLKINNVADKNVLKKIKDYYMTHLNNINNRVLKRKYNGELFLHNKKTK